MGTTVAPPRDKHLEAFLASYEARAASLPGDGRLRSLRASAIEQLATNGFPTFKNEEWKYTNVARLLRNPFAPGNPVKQPVGVRPAGGPHELVFLNGRFSRELSSAEAPPAGVRWRDLASALEDGDPAVEAHLGRYAAFESQAQAFVALNTAFFEDGAVIEIAPGAVIAEPLRLVFLTVESGVTSVAHPRVLVVAGENSQATVIESYAAGLASGVYWNNAVTEAVLAPGAHLRCVRLEREGPQGYHIATFQGRQERGSVLQSYTVTLGGALVRNDTDSVLGGEAAECGCYGLYVTAGSQHCDNHTLFDHAAPNTASNQLYKGILAGRSTGVFNGKIIVRKDAQKTNAYQSNKNLLLSPDATINTKPQLEIFADDVRCTHGATVGQLEDDALFYLRSRGIPAGQARILLIQAFASELIEQIPVEYLRNSLGKAIAEVLEGA